jgi:hypothetical protein
VLASRLTDFYNLSSGTRLGEPNAKLALDSLLFILDTKLFAKMSFSDDFLLCYGTTGIFLLLSKEST